MAKKSIVNRETKRRKMVARYKNQRAKLLAVSKDINASEEERYEARLKLQKLPRNSSATRLRNRCAITGRPRGVYRKFGLSRSMLRQLAMRGEIPGVVKSSW